MPICPRCGREVPHGYRFCPYCGLELEAAAEVKVIEHELEELRYKARSCELWALFFYSVFILFSLVAFLVNALGVLVDVVYRDIAMKMFYSSWLFFAVATGLLVKASDYSHRRSRLLRELKRRF